MKAPVVLSFDVGIRNLAMCIIEKTHNESEVIYKILNWKIINLMESETKVIKKCEADIKSGVKKGDKCQCPAFVEVIDKKESSFFCNKHNPCKKNKSLKFKKVNNKIKKVNSISTQRLCIMLCKNLNEVLETDNILDMIDEVLIELQPSLNPKMKSLSNMLYSYFIMKGIVDSEKIKCVKFVNAKNKLKVYTGPNVICKLKSKYSRTKFLGKKYCEWIITNNDQSNWLEFFKNCKKQDDLADCYLQGCWYLQNK